jgi:hypothetical protein
MLHSGKVDFCLLPKKKKWWYKARIGVKNNKFQVAFNERKMCIKMVSGSKDSDLSEDELALMIHGN